ncbi:MAG: hypothetical protein ACI9UR_001807 [Bacteroidia bacterium]|jgi:hypothetical protein
MALKTASPKNSSRSLLISVPSGSLSSAER